MSLALNLPGPAALLRCQQMGAQCTKLEPVSPASGESADPMQGYSPTAYGQLHAGITVLQANLKSDEGQALLHRLLAQADVLITSFRPSALIKLGLDWPVLHAQHAQLNMVRIFGSTAAQTMEHAGHDLTYQAQAGLIRDGHMPSSLFADMSGALMASEAVLQSLMLRQQSGHGHCLDIGLAQAAQWLALPCEWKISTPEGDVGGAHAGYQIYTCQDGWVALAALEPHFAQRFCQLAGITDTVANAAYMRRPATQAAVASFIGAHTCDSISAMATQCDIPLQAIRNRHK